MVVNESYGKTQKNSDTPNIALMVLKFQHCGVTVHLCIQRMHPKDANGTANNVDPDQTALEI